MALSEEAFLNTTTTLHDQMSPIDSITEVLSSIYSWIDNNPTVFLAVVTTLSVIFSIIFNSFSIRQSKRSIDKNSELVEANKEAVEETRKDHRRGSIKDLIIKLTEIKQEISTHTSFDKPGFHTSRTMAGPNAVGRPFVELDEWDLEIPHYLRGFIREETTSESPDLLSKYDEYKKNYKNYNNEYESLQSSISLSLKNHSVEIDWPENLPEETDKYTSGRKLSVDEAKQKIQDNPDEIAENIVKEGVVFRGYRNEYLSRLIYKFVEEEHSDRFEELREKLSELRSQYEALTRSAGPLQPDYFSSFILFLREKYEIPEIELNQEKEEDKDSKETRRMWEELLEEQTVNVKAESNPVINEGEVYISYKKYDKTEDDIDKNDYESPQEYFTTIDKETPGIPYDSIEILPSGWVKCTNNTKNPWKNGYIEQDEDRIHHSTDLYPSQVVERIDYYTVTIEDES